MSSPRHIILIGAARSGTKLLRDLIHDASGIGRVPYDIPFVWRYRQAERSDRLDPDALTTTQRRFIARYVERYAAGVPSAVIEKTVGNSIRVPFVHAVFPTASYIHLVRDGVDTIESTRRQWQAPSNRKYLLQKARHFPLRLIPTYGVKFVRDQLPSGDRSDRHVASWGVRYPEMDHDVRDADLLTVCARQWVWSVTQATRDFDLLSVPVNTVHYEDLIARPVETLGGLLDALDLAAPRGTIEKVASRVRIDRAGVGSTHLTASELELIDREAATALTQHGYARAAARTPGRGTS